MKKELCVLMIDDAAADIVLINHALRKAGLRFRSRRVESREAFLHELDHHPPDVILSDHGVPGFDGFTALAEARRQCPGVPFIFVTGVPGEQAADETLKSGADDYVLKERLHLLGPAIERALHDAQTRRRHQELEAALTDAEEHLHLLVAEAKEYATVLLDAEGRIASWNPAAERVFGFKPNEILGRECAVIFPAGENWTASLETAACQERAELSCDCQRNGGEAFRARVVVRPLRAGSRQERGFLCIVHDLSHHEARDRAAQWESAHREMERFTHSIAMDLRAPLRHIESFSELLHKSAGDQLDPKSRSYLKTISESVRHMSRLIDDLFTYSRIGHAEMHRLHLSLPDLTKEVMHDLRHETEGREVEWIVHGLPEVMGDPVMLWMALTNLISNALKFTRPRAKARIEIGGVTSPGEFVVFVRDNGVGFDMHYANRLFGVFQRLHSREFEGTGVGLANVRRIIERHGGRAWAEGVENEGATFYFALPRE